MTYNYRRVLAPAGAILLIGLTLTGCGTNKKEMPIPLQPRALAVVPFLNQSGSEHIDIMAVTDEFYTELQQVENFKVVPVDRVLSEMSKLDKNLNLRGPEDALTLAQNLGVEAVIVGAITRYDPYFPPKLGIIVQIYARDDKNLKTSANHVNPGNIARSPKPFRLTPAKPYQARAAVTRIFDADQNTVVEKIKAYAANRGGKDRPTSWKTYTTRRNYIRFVSYEIIRELLENEKNWLAALIPD